MLHIPSFLAPLRPDADRVEVILRVPLPVRTEGFIVPRASYKIVTNDACRGKKLLVIQQADAMISNIISDFISQRMPGGVGGLLSDGESYPDSASLFNTLIFFNFF